MKNKGFSLIEVIVAVAIIASLSGIVGVNLRKHMASAKDAKAIASLHSIRTAIQIYQLENDTPLFTTDSSNSYSKENVISTLEKLEPYLDNNLKALIKNPEFSVGGSIKIESDAQSQKIKYGGKVRLTFINPNGKSKEASVWLEPTDNTGELDIKGNKWTEY